MERQAVGITLSSMYLSTNKACDKAKGLVCHYQSWGGNMKRLLRIFLGIGLVVALTAFAFPVFTFFHAREPAGEVKLDLIEYAFEPDAHAAQGYAVGQLIEQAVVKAGSPEKRAVRDALFSLNARTVFGRFRVNAKGLQVEKTNAIVQWQRGVRQVVWPSWLQTARLQ